MTEQSQAPFVFISYATQDRDKAFEICRLLETRGQKCWIAPRDVRAGREYADEIVSGIERALALVLVLSSSANDSIFVRREVERAVSKKKPVFPIRIENVTPSPSLEFFVSSTHWIDAWSGGLSDHVDLLARDLSGGTFVIAEPSPLKKALRRWQTLLRGPMAIYAGIAAVIVIGGIYFLTRPPSEEAQFDRQSWQQAALADSADAYNTYLRLVPDGRHAREAKRRIEAIQQAEAERSVRTELQGLLASLGYDAGSADNPMNDKLEGAVREFQADNKLDVDGKMTPELVAAINKVRAANAPEISAHEQALVKKSRVAYENFLSRYATGRMADDVRARLASCHTETGPATRQKTSQVSAQGHGSGGGGGIACQTAESAARAEIQTACPGGVLGRIDVASKADAGATALGIMGSIIGGATNRNVNVQAACTATATANCTRVVTETTTREVCD
jgi:hypothetical protein